MKTETPPSLDSWTASLAGVADPTRLRLLHLLERHELTVSDVCEVLRLPQSTVSRHLKLLTDEGWTVTRREGARSLHRLILDELSPERRELWLLARQHTEHAAALRQDAVRLDQRLASQRGKAAFFDDAAHRWEQTRHELYGAVLDRSVLVEALPRDWSVLDLGCGAGALVGQLATSVARVVGVDESEPMLAIARQRLGDLPHVSLLPGKAEAPPVEPASFDLALLTLVLTYAEDPAATVAGAARTVKPGGRLLVLDLLRHDRDDFRRQMQQLRRGFEPDELAAALADAGLTDIRTRPVAPDPDAAGPALLLASGVRSDP